MGHLLQKSKCFFFQNIFKYMIFQRRQKVLSLSKGSTHISLASFLWDIANSGDPDQNAASDQGFHCLLTENSIKI